MKYGYFDDRAKEYVITDPKTPFPWINYLGNQDFFSIISNTGGGYSFYRDARLRRITRYRYNNIPIDNGGKYFYIKDGEDVWSPGWKPVQAPLEKYCCRHGLGYTILSSEFNSVKADLLNFIPLGLDGEVQQLQLTNNGAETKNLHIYSLVEFCLWDALDDMTNFQRNLSIGEVEVEESVIYHTTGYNERRNHFAFHSVNHPTDGFETDRDTFFGLNNGWENPEVVLTGQSKNSIAQGWSPIGSHHLSFTLVPGESTTLIFILGYVENPEEDKWEAPGSINKSKAKRMISQFQDPNTVEEALAELKEHFSELLSVHQLNSAESKLDRMVNTWNPYQCLVNYYMSRSASYFESGIGRGIGFRDSNQDVIGYVHLVPEKARDRILDLASIQFDDGSVSHQYQPLTKKGNENIGSNFNDDPLWLILSTMAYIKETGDWAVLDEPVLFHGNLNNKASLFEHLKRAFYQVVDNVGPNGLPRIGRADWNDCLNLNSFSTDPDESFQTASNKSRGSAESVMIAAMVVLFGADFVKMCRQKKLKDDADRAESCINQMEKTINRAGWDGQWFLRAYDYEGNKVGSKECEEGKIFIESQGFCVMAGIGLKDGKAQTALHSVKKYLACDYGIVLTHPAFTKYQINLGEITTYPPGYKENAGVFCHTNPWIIIAETLLGNGDQAFDYYCRNAPAYLQEISDLHKTEPYVYAQMISGKDSPKPGEAKNSWLTGAAAWNYYAISQFILGIRPDWDGLLIDPCIPKSWSGYTVKRKFRQATYTIHIRNPKHVNRGIKTIKVDGQPIADNLLPVYSDNKEHLVEVVMG